MEPVDSPRPPDVSVIIPTFNGAPWIAEQLDALARLTGGPSFEVVIADNGSTDRTTAIAESFADHLSLTLLDASSRKGQAAARNAGAHIARGDLLLFLDQDDVVHQGYVERMATALASSSIVAARVETSLLNRNWQRTPRRLAQEHGLAQGGPFTWGYGGTLGIRRNLFMSLGGFNQGLRGGGEDEDLCWRAGLLGHSLVFVDDAVVSYRCPSTTWALFLQGRRYGAAQVRLERRYSVWGAPRMSLWRSLGLSVRLGARCLFTANRDDRAAHTFLLGRHLGAAAELLAEAPSGSRPRDVEHVDRTECSTEEIPVVVVHWRSPARCHRTVGSLIAQAGVGRITIVDNSGEATGVQWPPGVDVVRPATNCGFAGGANIGLVRSMASGSIAVLVMSHDAELEPGGLARLVTTLRTNSDIGVLGPRHDLVGEGGELCKPGPHQLAEVDFVSGTCLLLRSECLREIGGFDAGLGSYCEDVDLAYRARRAGWRVMVDNAVAVTSRGSTSPMRDRMIRSNAVVVLRRHRGVRAAAGSYVRTATDVVRNVGGAAALWRPREKRKISWRRARVLGGALTSPLDVVVEHPSHHHLTAMQPQPRTVQGER